MRGIQAAAVVCAVVLVSGCANALKTMVAHTTIDNKAVYFLAKANADVNVCLAQKAIDRQRAFEFSTIAAQFLDLVVFDESYFQRVYDEQLKATAASTSSLCNSLDNELPKMTAFLHENYNTIAARLGRMRAEENRQIMESISSFRMSAPYSSPQPARFPPLQFRQESPPTQNYLVNTKKGLVQCKVTSNSYVFCL